MSWYYLKALAGEAPWCHWYGLPEKKPFKPFHPERRPPDCPHDCTSCPKALFGECGFFDDDDTNVGSAKDKPLSDVDKVLAESEKLLAQVERNRSKIRKLLGEPEPPKEIKAPPCSLNWTQCLGCPKVGTDKCTIMK